MKFKDYIIEGLSYKINSIIQYRTLGGGIRVVKVTDKDDDIKNGKPGFDAIELDPRTKKPKPSPVRGDKYAFVWGYDEDIEKVIKK